MHSASLVVSSGRNLLSTCDASVEKCLNFSAFSLVHCLESGGERLTLCVEKHFLYNTWMAAEYDKPKSRRGNAEMQRTVTCWTE